MYAERQTAEALGLYCVNLSVDIKTLNDDIIALVLQQIHQLPKPILMLIHCDNAVRSAAFTLIYIATSQGTTYQQALQQVEKLELFTRSKPSSIVSP